MSSVFVCGIWRSEVGVFEGSKVFGITVTFYLDKSSQQRCQDFDAT